MKKKIILLLLSICLLLIPYTAYALSTDQAKEPINTDESCSFFLRYASGEHAFDDVEVPLYQVAEVSRDSYYTLTEAFTDSHVSLNGITAQREWDTVRSTLSAYVAAQKPDPTDVAPTDSDGLAAFAYLEPGMYFVPARSIVRDGFVYYFQPTLVALPGLQEDKTWDYSVHATPKPDVRPPSSEDLEYRVLKLWKDDGAENRPESIQVNLLKDGAVMRTVTLSEENGWCYAWYSPDDGSTWTVSEVNIPHGYTVTVEQNETVFSLVNTHSDPSDDSSIPETGDTGNLGFYVLFLCGAGILLLLLGFRRRKAVE